MLSFSKSRTFHILALQAGYVFATQVSTAIFFPYLKLHFSFALISLYLFFFHAVSVVLQPFVRRFRVRPMIIASLIISTLRVLLARYVDTPLELYGFGILSGFALVLFWIPTEILYFKEHNTSRHGIRSAYYFAMLGFPGILLPALTGVVADRWGFNVLFYASAALMFVPLVFALRIPNETVSVTLRSSLTKLRGVRSVLAFDGFFFSFQQVLIGLSLLRFTKTAGQFGLVTSLAAIGALIASLAAARASDARGSRTAFLYPASIISAVLLAIMGFQTALVAFTILLIIFSSLRTVIQPLMNALPMDLCDDHAALYIGRQFLINLGRIIGFALTWALVLLDETRGLLIMYLVYAASYLVFILIIRRALRRNRTAMPHPVAPES